ncbi:MAG: DUF4012 domain-containing protein [Patescibacteria group bacterium]|nr:DUF4012 domain-containing protein [Patescibacteria group bacterium]
MNNPKLNMMKARSGATRKRPVSRIVIIVAVAVVLVAVGIFVAHPFYRAARAAMAHIETGETYLAEAESAARQLDLRGAIENLSSAEVEFAGAKDALDRLGPLSGFPVVGKKVTAATEIVESGLLAMSGVREAFGVAEDVLGAVREGEELTGSFAGIFPDVTVPFRELTAERKREMLAALERSAPRISSAVASLDSSLARLDAVPEGVFGGELERSLASATEKIENLRDALAVLMPVADLLPMLLGHDEDRRYLLFFMNNTEMRPTGGFLGVYGTVTVRDAELISMDTNDVYYLDGPSEGLDRPPPPEPIRRYIGIDKWYLRDANWSPDFPTSARVMERFYLEEAAVVGEDTSEIDGIIGVTPEVAADVLRIIGPVTVEGKTFEADGFTDQLEFEVEQGFALEGIPHFARKDIIGVLMQEMFDRVTSLSFGDLLRVAKSAEQNLEEAHAVAYMKDQRAQDFILQKDWGGRLRPVEHDYVSVIDANLASLKSDPAVDRRIRYSVYLNDEGDYEARVAVTYDHHGGFDWKTTRYRTYTRVYVPVGSVLLSVEGAMMDDHLKDPARRPGTADTYDELDRTAFGAFISIEPGESGTLEFRYLLPTLVADAIDDGNYALTVEKQPGTTGHGLTLELDFGKKLTDAAPAEDPAEWGDGAYRYSTDLRIDREFSVETEGN